MGGGGHAVGLLLCAVQKPEGTPAPSNPDEIGSGTGLQLQLNKIEAAASNLTALLAGAMSCHRGVFRKKNCSQHCALQSSEQTCGQELFLKMPLWQGMLPAAHVPPLWRQLVRP